MDKHFNDQEADAATSEKQMIETFIREYISESKRNRRWSIFFKLFFLCFFVLGFWSLLPSDPLAKQAVLRPHTALIDIRGEIGANSAANADDIATSLNSAFTDRNTVGIILRINSPGGSPVQASYVYNEIRRLQKQHDKIRVFSVCVDVCASAAYYIASAGDLIYANPSSIVGSIGVMMDGFGFPDAMQKLGVQRRLVTAGSHKDFLDPFLPLKADDQKIAQEMLDDVHRQFIKDIETTRGNRLKKNPLLYSGLAWTGNQAMGLGLIDGFGSTGYVAREVIRSDNIVDYTIRPGFFEQLASRVSSEFANVILTKLHPKFI